MVTNAGGGYSLWNDTALTRWREDPTRDCWGTFIYFRDARQRPVLVRRASTHLAGRHELRSHFQPGPRRISLAAITRSMPTPKSRCRRKMTSKCAASRSPIIPNETADDRSHELCRSGVEHAGRRPGASGLQQAVHSDAKFSGREMPSFARAGRAPAANNRRGCFISCSLQGNEVGEASFETDRAQFLGRGRDAASPAALRNHRPRFPTRAGSGAGSRRRHPAHRSHCAQGKRPHHSGHRQRRDARGAAAARGKISGPIHRRPRASSWPGRMGWSPCGISMRPNRRRSCLAGSPARCSTASRCAARARAFSRKIAAASAISGALAFPATCRSCSCVPPASERIELVREVLQAHAYWRLKGLAVDLVILNEDDSVYRQSVHDQIMTLIASGIEAQLLDKPGGIFVRRGRSVVARRSCCCLQTAARIVLSDENGHVGRTTATPRPARTVVPPLRLRNASAGLKALPAAELPKRDLIFFNGLGGFTPDGREYVITLRPGPDDARALGERDCQSRIRHG